MKINFLAAISISLFLFCCCSSQKAIIESSDNKTTVALDADQAMLVSEAKYFGNNAVNLSQDRDLVHVIGDSLLKAVINGYSQIIPDYTYSNDAMNADWLLVIEKIEIEKGLFMTLNLTHPGPFLKVSMTTSIWNGKDPVKTKIYSSRVNMSRANFKNESVYWMSKPEKEDPVLQIRTLEAALKNLYQKLYFESFGITL